MSDLHKAMIIKEIIKESSLVSTYILDSGYNSKPGQFVMVWMPWVNEKPISVAYQDDTEMHLTVAAVGPFTKKMEELKVGDRIGIRGPFWTTFSTDKKRHCLVGGWVWVPPLFNTANELRKQWKEVDFIIGSRNKDLLIFEEKLKQIGVNVHVCTDDWSSGFHWFTTQKLEELINDGNKFDMIQTCGPEMMMFFIAKIAEKYNIESEVSMERYMKCGIWVCGQCAVDGEWICMCKEGPIIKWSRALWWEEFGKYHRKSTGEKINW